MLTIFAKPNRRFHTADGGLRFWMLPVALQAAHHQARQTEPTSETEINLNLLLEPRRPADGFQKYFSDVLETESSALTRFAPRPLQGADIDVRFQSEPHASILSDLERAFDNAGLHLAISWTDSRDLHFEDFSGWLTGQDIAMPNSFWLDEIPDISLVRQLP